MTRPIHSRLRDPLAAPLVVLALALSPFTAPFSTSDLSDHHGDSVARQAEIFAAKMAVDEDLAVVGAPPVAETASPVFLLVAGPAVADETSKHQIPSPILRL
jgi:hypothetical protein